MKSLNKTAKKLILIGILVSGIFFLSKALATIPNEYIANSEIKTDRDKIFGILVQIDAASKIGDQVPAVKFDELNKSFQNVFPKFPQDYSFQVTYQQCLSLSNALINYTSSDYQNRLGSFLSNCYKPFNDIIKKINNKYTVIAKAKALPASGPAPLTVTFDARTSVDPSNETIPSKNFFRYYRDTDGLDKAIGVGPLVSTTFANAGTYQVHLTVRSSNKLTKGIFDGEQTLSVDVTPKSAILTIYANGQKFKKDTQIKIGTLEAQKGVILDGSASIPMGGRQLLSNHREITTKDGFSFLKDGDGKPGIIRVSLPGNGEYKVQLTTTDNENNKITESYSLVVADPIAIIRQNPERGNTSTLFLFDSSPSYSVTSTIKLFTREIYDSDGNKLETFQGQSIKQTFKKPGTYTIKLTVEDEIGQMNIDTVQVFVESTDPIPQFSMIPTNQWKDPSRFILDASSSSDIDETNGFDKLSYEWSFPNDDKTKITQTDENNEKITVEFNDVGKHTIKLTAKDEYGKIGEITKQVEIKSILRPEVSIDPIATNRGTPINFAVKSNVPIVNYSRNFGDGNSRSIQSDSIVHTYKKTGVYKMTLSVAGEDDTTNQVSRTIFVGEKQYPIAGYIVLDKNSTTLTQNETCYDPNNTGLTYPAYQIERYQDFSVDPSISVNTKGEKSNLDFFFQPRDGEIFKQSIFRYKFNELGCNYIDLTASDTSAGKDNKVRAWFKVINALPKLDNIILLFPQYGNEVGIGFNENNVKDIFNDQYDPLIVKVTATNAIDTDGFISYFKFYYYYKDDPTRYLETKITPGNIPYTFFSLPRIPGEFMFGVTMYDNDDGKQSNQDIIGNGPLVFFPPDTSRPDIPLVTFKASQASVEVGDELTFNVISKIISDRPDFIKERTIQYDFDGDGLRDLTSKSDRVKYAYTKPNETGYKPRAAVLYRGYKGVGVGGTIIVKNGLKPMLLMSSYDKTAIFRDVSIGDVSNKDICLNIKTCKTNSEYLVRSGSAFVFKYPSYGKYFLSMDVTDKYANQANKKWILNIISGRNDSEMKLISIPEYSITSGNSMEIFVGNNLDNSVLFYVSYNISRGICYVDTDINSDGDVDGIKDNDKDFMCNQLYLKKYEPKYESSIGRVFYTKADNRLISQDFTISFLDFQANLDSQTMDIYKEINDLIVSIPDIDGTTGDYKTFKNLLIALRDGLIDKVNTKSNLISVKDFKEKNENIKLNADQSAKLEDIIMKLTDKSVAAAGGGSEYDKAKAEILSILPNNLSTDINMMFKDFEIAVSDQITQSSQQDKRLEALNKIISTINKSLAPQGATVKEDQVDPLDMKNTIMPNMCKIVKFYGMVSDACPDQDTKITKENIKVETGTTKNWLKIILISLGILIGVFVVVVVIFAIRAKMNQEGETGEAETNGGENPKS